MRNNTPYAYGREGGSSQAHLGLFFPLSGTELQSIVSMPQTGFVCACCGRSVVADATPQPEIKVDFRTVGKITDHNNSLYPPYHHIGKVDDCFYALAEKFRLDPVLDVEEFSPFQRAQRLVDWKQRRENIESFLENLDFSYAVIEENKRAVEQFDKENPGAIKETVRFLLENLNKERLTENDWEHIDHTINLFMPVIGLAKDPWYLAFLVAQYYGLPQSEGQLRHFYIPICDSGHEGTHEEVPMIFSPDGKTHKFHKPKFLQRFHIDEKGRHQKDTSPFDQELVIRPVTESFVKDIEYFAKTKEPRPLVDSRRLLRFIHP